jgi:hypothetical protein
MGKRRGWAHGKIGVHGPHEYMLHMLEQSALSVRDSRSLEACSFGRHTSVFDGIRRGSKPVERALVLCNSSSDDERGMAGLTSANIEVNMSMDRHTYALQV